MSSRRTWSPHRYRYSVHFEDGRDVTTNYVGEVLQVGDDITLEGRQWVITDAKVLSDRDRW
jgi:ferredoxin-NADP reductase